MIERKFNQRISHDKIRLHSSERNQIWDSLFSEFKRLIDDKDIRFYPNLNTLYDKCCKFFDYKHIIIGNGSDRCIKYFFEVNTHKSKLITTDPSFPMYEVYAQMHKYQTVKVQYKDTKFPIEDFLNHIDIDSVIAISNPSTPVADILTLDTLRAILDKGVPTLIDEAYIEFAGIPSSKNLIEEYPNLYVTRTFSKAIGSAGMRIGVLLSNEHNIKRVLQYRDMYEVSGLSAKWAELVLDNYDKVSNYIESTLEKKKSIIKVLESKNISYLDSKSNWIHIQEPFIVPDGIVIRRDCTLPGMPGKWTRMSICNSVDYNWIK